MVRTNKQYVVEEFDDDGLSTVGSEVSGDGLPTTLKVATETESAWQQYWTEFKTQAIFPQSALRRTWDLVIFLAVTYDVVMIPVRLTFPVGEGIGSLEWFWRTLDYFSDLLLIVDIVWRFFLGFNNMGLIVTDRGMVVRTYLKGRFALDLMASIPLDLAFPSASIKLRAMMRMNRFIRLYRFPGYFYYWERTSSQPNLFRLMKLLAIVYMLAHWVACIFFEIVKMEYSWYGRNFWRPTETNPNRQPWAGEIENYFDQTTVTIYLRALFWSITLLTGMGPDHNNPITDMELVFMAFVLTLGMLVFAAIIANVGQLLSSTNATEEDFRKKMDVVNIWMRYKGIKPKLQLRIRSYYEYLWTRQAGLDDKEILENMPAHLRGTISTDLNKGMVQKVPFFGACEDEGFFMALSKRLQPEIYTPGDHIIREKEIGSAMYFITKGTVGVHISGQGQVNTLGPGRFFGEIALLIKTKRIASIVAISYVDVFVLTKVDVDETLQYFPIYSQYIYELARQHVQDERTKARLAKSASGKASKSGGLSSHQGGGGGGGGGGSSGATLTPGVRSGPHLEASNSDSDISRRASMKPSEWLETVGALAKDGVLRDMNGRQLIKAQKAVAALSLSLADACARAQADELY